MAFHDLSVTYHSILDQGQVLCISKILNYQPPPTSHILNHAHQHRPATERIHRCTDTWWKLLLVYVLWEICEYCMTMRGNTQARAHTHRAHILHATSIPIPLARADLTPSLNLEIQRIDIFCWGSWSTSTSWWIICAFGKILPNTP